MLAESSRGLFRDVLDDVRRWRVVLVVQVDCTAERSFIVRQVDDPRSP